MIVPVPIVVAFAVVLWLLVAAVVTLGLRARRRKRVTQAKLFTAYPDGRTEEVTLTPEQSEVFLRKHLNVNGDDLARLLSTCADTNGVEQRDEV